MQNHLLRLHSLKIYVVYLSKEDIKAALTETQAEILWESVLGVTGIHHVHFIAPHADGIFTKMITNEDGGTIHTLTKSSMLPQKIEASKNLACKIDEFVIVKYDSLYFPGIIVSLNEGGAEVKVMTPSGPTYWKWPEKDDIITYP